MNCLYTLKNWVRIQNKLVPKHPFSFFLPTLHHHHPFSTSSFCLSPRAAVLVVALPQDHPVISASGPHTRLPPGLTTERAGDQGQLDLSCHLAQLCLVTHQPQLSDPSHWNNIISLTEGPLHPSFWWKLTKQVNGSSLFVGWSETCQPSKSSTAWPRFCSSLFLLLNLCHHLPQPHSWCSGDTEWFQFQGKKKQKQKRLVYFLMLLSLPGMLFFSLDCLNPTSNLLQGPHQTLPLPWESPVCPGEKSCCDTHGSLCGLLPLSPHTTVTCVCIASPQRNYTPSGRNQHSYSGSTTTLALIKMHWMNKQPRIFQNNSIETPTQTKWIRRTPLKSQLILKEVHTSLQPMPKHWPNNSVHFEVTRDSLCLSYRPSTWVSEEAVSLLLAKNPSDDLLMR